MTNVVGPVFKHWVFGRFLGDMLVLVSSVLNEHFAKRMDGLEPKDAGLP